jgi:MFS superfamily sulfate permease-like transporter
MLAGLTVSFALVPEATAFAFVAGVNPLVALYGASIMPMITSLFGGRPGMISGAAGATVRHSAPCHHGCTLRRCIRAVSLKQNRMHSMHRFGHNCAHNSQATPTYSGSVHFRDNSRQRNRLGSGRGAV